MLANSADIDLNFEQFAAWIQSSSPLADKMRKKLGGALDEAFNIDDLGIEERETYDGWLYMFPGDPQCTIFVLLEVRTQATWHAQCTGLCISVNNPDSDD